MNHTSFKRWIYLILMVLITMIWPVSTRAQTQSKAPGEPGLSVSFTSEVEKLFHKARDNFLKKDYQSSAEEIRQGAAWLKKQAEQATGEAKQALMASARELGQLADRERKGAVNSAQELEQAFARADHALAGYYQSRASESWARRAVSEAGRGLRAAAVHLENALGWADYRLEGENRATIKAAKEIGEKMEQGAGWVDSEVRKSIDSIGKEIDEASRKIPFHQK
jgi:hypothetical protein